MRKEFYRMSLHATESGLEVFAETYVSIHETECFNFCVRERHLLRVERWRAGDETLMQSAKARHIKVYRIAKACSRIAFATKEKALENLKYRKRRQVMHLARELKFAESFLDATASDDFKLDASGVIDGTHELVHEHLNFY
jgi:hypothetical protein